MSCFRAESTGFLQKCFLLDVQLLSPAPKSRSGTLISGRLLLLCFCFRHKNPKIPQKMLTNYHPGGNIYRQSMDCKTEYGRVPEWPMGTDCKSAAFSFGGSNPPAPTKQEKSEPVSDWRRVRIFRFSGTTMKAPMDGVKLRYLVIDRKPITRFGGYDYEVR